MQARRMPNQGAVLNRYARVAGFMYLFVIAVYIVGDNITSAYQQAGDFTQIAARMRGGEMLYRSGLALELVSSVATVLLGGAFFVLLSPVDRNLALFAFLWRVMEAVFGGITVTLQYAALPMYLGSTSSVPVSQQAGLAQLAGEVTRASFPVSVIYFSAGSLLYFSLLFRARVIPRGLGALGLFASFLVMLMGFLTLIAPGAAHAVQFLWAPIFVAEVVTGLWLLVKGANQAYLIHM